MDETPFDIPAVAITPAESILKDPPPELVKFIDLLSNPSLVPKDIDYLMGWDAGQTRKKLLQYPILARTANEAKVIAYRMVGVDSPRLSAYKAYVDALEATRSEQVGYDGSTEQGIFEKVPDHRIRIDAANKILKSLGDDVGVVVNNNETELHVKIYNLIKERNATTVKTEFEASGQEMPQGLQIVS